ncbi:MAG TPA: tRNA pseudouridine(54/55) synthase Pus10 [Nitrososphaera sp.]
MEGLVLAHDRNSLAAQLKQYRLCNRCSERQGAIARTKLSQPCFICRGLMEKLDSLTEKIKTAICDYEFDTFLVGATLPTQIYEREDALRARLKIRGMESVKNQLTRELGMRLARQTRGKVDYLRPDITISLAIDKENSIDVTAKSRPLALAGRYTKKASGMPQKQDRCPDCEGKGCGSCNHSGLSGYDSIEGVIAKKLMAITKGITPRFSWIGSEDQNSQVLGKGRPFYARVSDPRKRNFRKITIRGNGVQAILSTVDELPTTQPRFIVKTRIHIRCDKNLTKKELQALRELAGREVSYRNRSKMATKRIRSASVRRIDSNNLVLTVVADGGLMIKQFVGGEEYMKPNISEVLGCKCECVRFDILDVELQ